jgi:hypothetical protein
MPKSIASENAKLCIRIQHQKAARNIACLHLHDCEPVVNAPRKGVTEHLQRTLGDSQRILIEQHISYLDHRTPPVVSCKTEL